MNYEPPCAVCHRSVDPSVDHAVVELEYKHANDRNELQDYYLHERCARAVLGGWCKP